MTQKQKRIYNAILKAHPEPCYSLESLQKMCLPELMEFVDAIEIKIDEAHPHYDTLTITGRIGEEDSEDALCISYCRYYAKQKVWEGVAPQFTWDNIEIVVAVPKTITVPEYVSEQALIKENKILRRFIEQVADFSGYGPCTEMVSRAQKMVSEWRDNKCLSI